MLETFLPSFNDGIRALLHSSGIILTIITFCTLSPTVAGWLLKPTKKQPIQVPVRTDKQFSRVPVQPWHHRRSTLILKCRVYPFSLSNIFSVLIYNVLPTLSQFFTGKRCDFTRTGKSKMQKFCPKFWTNWKQIYRSHKNCKNKYTI